MADEIVEETPQVLRLSFQPFDDLPQVSVG
jgi:hypothetical protein